MKKLYLPLLAALVVLSCSFFAVFGGASAQAADDDIYKTITYRQLYSLMGKFGYTVEMKSEDDSDIEAYGDDDFIWWITEYDRMPRIDIGDNGRRVEFYIFYPADHRDLVERSNTWNKDHFYGRAHVSKTGRAVLEYELDLTGGVTEARIRDFFKACLANLKTWKRDVVD